MGAGDFPAGAGFAGHSPVVPAGADATSIRSAYFDMITRSFPLDAQGELQRVHAVDQEVALALGISLTGVSSSIATGLDTRRLRRTSRQAMELTVLSVVRDALATLIDAGDIRFLGAPLAPDANGRPFFYVDYVNLRIPSVRARVSVRV